MLGRFQDKSGAPRRTRYFSGTVDYLRASADLGSVHRLRSKVRNQSQGRAVAHSPLYGNALGAEHPIMAGGSLDTDQPGHDLAAADRQRPATLHDPDGLARSSRAWTFRRSRAG